VRAWALAGGMATSDWWREEGPTAGDAWSRRHAPWSGFGCCVGVSSCGALAHGLWSFVSPTPSSNPHAGVNLATHDGATSAALWTNRHGCGLGR
jgi:hypothetical protein